MNELIQKLEAAVVRRTPSLAQGLQPGLPEKKIRSELQRAGIDGAIKPLIELYSWRNGTIAGDSFDLPLTGGFVPPRRIPLAPHEIEIMKSMGVARDSSTERFHFYDLKQSIRNASRIQSGAKYNAELGKLVGRYFPILWDHSNAFIALDLSPDAGNRVVKVRRKLEEQHWQAYASFDDFLKDAICCNEANEPLACLLSETAPIAYEPPDQIPKPIAKPGERLPETKKTLLVRTDYSDEPAWNALVAAIKSHVDPELGPDLEIISDPAWQGLTAERLPSVISKDTDATFAFLADRDAMSHPEHAVLVVNATKKKSKTFRAIPKALGEVENNLSTANMNFGEFVKAAGKSGVFRGIDE